MGEFSFLHLALIVVFVVLPTIYFWSTIQNHPLFHEVAESSPYLPAVITVCASILDAILFFSVYHFFSSSLATTFGTLLTLVISILHLSAIAVAFSFLLTKQQKKFLLSICVCIGASFLTLVIENKLHLPQKRAQLVQQNALPAGK